LYVSEIDVAWFHSFITLLHGVSHRTTTAWMGCTVVCTPPSHHNIHFSNILTGMQHIKDIFSSVCFFYHIFHNPLIVSQKMHPDIPNGNPQLQVLHLQQITSNQQDLRPHRTTQNGGNTQLARPKPTTGATGSPIPLLIVGGFSSSNQHRAGSFLPRVLSQSSSSKPSNSKFLCQGRDQAWHHRIMAILRISRSQNI